MRCICRAVAGWLAGWYPDDETLNVTLRSDDDCCPHVNDENTTTKQKKKKMQPLQNAWGEALRIHQSSSSSSSNYAQHMQTSLWCGGCMLLWTKVKYKKKCRQTGRKTHVCWSTWVKNFPFCCGKNVCGCQWKVTAASHMMLLLRKNCHNQTASQGRKWVTTS